MRPPASSAQAKAGLAALLLLGSAAGVGALDFGANVTQVPLLLAGPNSLFVESVKTSTWVALPWGDYDFRVQGEASWSVSTPGDTWTASPVTFDLTEASFKGNSALDSGNQGVLETEVGRHMVTDLTGGWVLGSRWDGVGLSWLKGAATLSGSLGYSGLLSKKTSRIAFSAADVADNADARVTTAPRRVYASVGGGLNELFWRQDLQAEVLGNLDLRAGDTVHSAYLTAQVSGPMPLGFRHKSFATASLAGASGNLRVASLLGTEASASIPFWGSRVVLSGAFGVGQGAEGFSPLSGKGLAEVVSLPTAHGAALGGDYSLKPFAKTTVGVKSSLLFRTSDDPVGLPGFQSGSADRFLGAEAGLYGTWNPTSESSFGLNAGVFLPQSGPFAPETAPSMLLIVTATVKL